MTNRHAFIAGIGVVFAALVIVKIWTPAETFSLNESAPTTTAHSASTTNPVEANRAKAIPSGPQNPPARNLEGQPALFPPDPSELSVSTAPPLANLLGQSGTKPEEEAKIVLDLLKTYRRLLGAYPAGEDNRQFVNALLGANKDHLPLLSKDHPRLNSKGELIDAWGTPFFFHQNSRTSIEVRSAGADRAFFTADDIVAGKPPASLGQSVISDENISDN